MKAPHARREISGACVLNEGAAPAAATRSSPRTARPPDSRPRAQVQILAHGGEIFVFLSLLKTIFRKIPTPKHFLKIDHF